MEISGWGRYPRVEAEILYPSTTAELASTIAGADSTLIPMGMGRSYGDSALAKRVVDTRYLDHLIDFSDATGVLTCAGGATLFDILQVFVPRGWFPPVTPGTKFVTVGGAVASDVHGKNHHLEGSFCDHVLSLKLLLASGELIDCSPTANPELFRATCGGMGLTGIITEVSLKMKPVPGAGIDATTRKARNLSEALELFEQHRKATYSVAWIDCLAKGSALGRSLVTTGEHTGTGDKAPRRPTPLTLPVDMPGWLLNKFSIRAFNELYYRKQRKAATSHTCHYDPFFYPLDSIHHWNRLYGRNGFLQYQFVLPEAASPEGITRVLEKISNAGKGSFLAVLKAFGPENENYLSFPMKGLTLALDFRMERDLLPFLGELDRIVADHGGRHYLAKDARLPKSVFRQGYPDWEKFVAIRRKYNADKLFNSLQSLRLGL